MLGRRVKSLEGWGNRTDPRENRKGHATCRFDPEEPTNFDVMRVYVITEGRTEDDELLDVVPEDQLEAYIDAKSKELEAEMLRWETAWPSPNKVVRVVAPMERFNNSCKGLDVNGKVESGTFGVRYTVITEVDATPRVREKRVSYDVRDLWQVGMPCKQTL